jgi:hypothetical protein
MRYVYPAILMGLGVWGSAYMIGAQIRGAKASLGEQIEALQKDVDGLQSDTKELLARRTKLRSPKKGSGAEKMPTEQANHE